MLTVEQAWQILVDTTSKFKEEPAVANDLERVMRAKERLLTTDAQTLERRYELELAVVRRSIENIAEGKTFMYVVPGGGGVIRAQIDFDERGGKYGITQADGFSSVDIGRERIEMPIPGPVRPKTEG